MPNSRLKSREAELAVRLKVFKLKYQGYLEKRYTDLLVPRFAVTKVSLDNVVTDIRVVWDCRINGHNATLWQPGFRLPTFADAADMVVKWLSIPVGDYLAQGSPVMDYTQDASVFTKTYQGDVDVGAMFNNFVAHESERHSLGVRFIHTDPKTLKELETFLRFCSLNFGNMTSPVLACQGQTRILELVMRPPTDPTSAFQWHQVTLNCPFSPHYDPSLPWVLVLRRDNELACRQATYVDDIRATGRGKSLARAGIKQLKSGMNSLGNQADDRKYRQPSTAAGAWKGCIILTNTPFPRKSTTGKKWARFKQGLVTVLQLHEAEGRALTLTLR